MSCLLDKSKCTLDFYYFKTKVYLYFKNPKLMTGREENNCQINVFFNGVNRFRFIK